MRSWKLPASGRPRPVPLEHEERNGSSASARPDERAAGRFDSLFERFVESFHLPAEARPVTSAKRGERVYAPYVASRYAVMSADSNIAVSVFGSTR